MHLWKHSFRGKTLIFAITAAACQAFLLLGFDQGKQPLLSVDTIAFDEQN